MSMSRQYIILYNKLKLFLKKIVNQYFQYHLSKFYLQRVLVIEQYNSLFYEFDLVWVSLAKGIYLIYIIYIIYEVIW